MSTDNSIQHLYSFGNEYQSCHPNIVFSIYLQWNPSSEPLIFFLSFPSVNMLIQYIINEVKNNIDQYTNKIDYHFYDSMFRLDIITDFNIYSYYLFNSDYYRLFNSTIINLIDTYGGLDLVPSELNNTVLPSNYIIHQSNLDNINSLLTSTNPNSADSLSLTNSIPLANSIPPTNSIPLANSIPPTNLISPTNSIPPTNSISLSNSISPTNLISPTNSIPPTNSISLSNSISPTNSIPPTNSISLSNSIPLLNSIPIDNSIPLTNSIPSTNLIPLVESTSMTNPINVNSIPLLNSNNINVTETSSYLSSLMPSNGLSLFNQSSLSRVVQPATSKTGSKFEPPLSSLYYSTYL